MRNIFDQYTQPENRVTHALITALHEDRTLLRAFLKEIARTAPKKSKNRIEIYEQTYPSAAEEQETDETETHRKGIPDAWITNNDEWCLLIENKVLSAPTNDQLIRHIQTAKRIGFSDPKVLVLTVLKPRGKFPKGSRVIEWREVYQWLDTHAPKRPWAKHVAEFLELMESRMVENKQLKSGTLTAFNGFPFSSEYPFSYLEAKRILRLVTAELRKRKDLKTKLRVDSGLPGRKSISEQGGDAVWDFLQVREARGANSFTKFPHLTLGITRTEVQTMITIPDKVRNVSLRRLRKLETEGFNELIHEILKQMRPLLKKCKGMEPRLRAVQRRYPAQKSIPFYDAVIDFDLRTGFDGMEPTKTQPQWLDAVFGCLVNKKSNFQFQVGAYFPYRTCQSVRSVDILDRIAEAWIACYPLVAILVKD